MVGAEVHKSWKKINEERKTLKRQRKQEKLLKQMEKKQFLDQKTLSKQQPNESIPVEKKPNTSTVSIAVPGSILENAQSIELRSYVAGQIARAACIFRVNEVIVFDDVGVETAKETKRSYEMIEKIGNEDKARSMRSSCLQLARILQYLECPQYLRKFFFPLHKDLKYSGLLNPLDAPHHLRQQNLFRYREGIVTEKQAKEGHCYVNVGLLNDVLVNKALTAGLRVTVKLNSTQENSRKLRGTIVSPEEPRRETGVYWGYTVRISHSISEIFTKSPYPGGYDLTIGTSDRGANVHQVPSKSVKYNHLLVVFGGLQGLESALANDDKLQIDDPELLFDHYLNVLPKQGSRTIRTEEALLIAMTSLQEKLNPITEDVEEEQIKEALPRSEDTGYIITKPAQTKMANKRKRLEQDQVKVIDQIGTNKEIVPVIKTNKDATVAKNLTGHEKSKKNYLFQSPSSPDRAYASDDGFEVVSSDNLKINKSKQCTNNDLNRFD